MKMFVIWNGSFILKWRDYIIEAHTDNRSDYFMFTVLCSCICKLENDEQKCGEDEEAWMLSLWHNQ